MNALVVYTIYRKPKDFPDKFVVRVFCISEGPEPIPAAKPHAVVDTLEEARLSVPPHLVGITRSPGDDPSIVETWL